jgi:hypothetical protein
MTSKEIQYMHGTVYMPDGTPAPYVMTADDAVKFLRLDTNGNKHPDTTLQYYIDEQMLVAITIGKCRKYPLPELLRFIDRLIQAKENTS